MDAADLTPFERLFKAPFTELLFLGHPQVTSVRGAIAVVNNGRLLNAVEQKFVSLNKSLRSLADEEFDAVMTCNDPRILEWTRKRQSEEK